MNKILSFFSQKQGSNPEALLAPHMNLLFKMAYQFTGNSHDAEDLLQELLQELFIDTTKWQDIEHLKAWLIRCLRNKFIDNYRKNKHYNYLESLQDEHTTNLVSHPTAHEDQILNKQILTALDELSSAQRSIICLHDINGYSLPELSEILEKPLGTLKSDLHRAREKIKMFLTMQPSELTLRSTNRGK